jgi:hypothetical protein
MAKSLLPSWMHAVGNALSETAHTVEGAARTARKTVEWVESGVDGGREITDTILGEKKRELLAQYQVT